MLNKQVKKVKKVKQYKKVKKIKKDKKINKSTSKINIKDGYGVSLNFLKSLLNKEKIYEKKKK